MLQSGGNVNLRKESFGTEYCGELGMYDLDCDLTLVAQIFSKVDGGHAALSQLALDSVFASESRGEAGDCVISHPGP